MENQQDILIEQRGAAGVITINRPAALNALNLNVLRGMWDALQSWKDDPAIKAVVLTGAGHKAFCAGGDLKHFHGAGQAYKRGEADLMHPVSFFSLEYSLNTLIYHYPKPIVALMNGITMGGGYGLAGNSSIRVACEETLFAMPETKIGFFPDVGAVSHLVKAPSHIGRYLAMTGNTLPGGRYGVSGAGGLFG
ncbi:MAG: enoyl-CoA hydratase/isomerase family protein [Alphaproteobacteria bacterium]|nr:enoyl-CoA hydratase/isomerase family protein [Alphaproteobacteria bacterium]